MQKLRLDVRVVYSSPLRRAFESAELLGRPIIVIPELAEIGLGEWDGRTWAEIEVQYPEMVRLKLADWTGVTPPGGEPWNDFRARVAGALDVVRRGPFPAAVVAHVAVNACIASLISQTAELSFRQEYAQSDAFEL